MKINKYPPKTTSNLIYRIRTVGDTLLPIMIKIVELQGLQGCVLNFSQ